jgi:hypothetical protein
MTSLSLQVTVYGLIPGEVYNLYEYDRNFAPDYLNYPTGAVAALAVSTGDFNSNAGLATNTTKFTATGPTFTKTVSTTSNQIVVFRAVRVDAP